MLQFNVSLEAQFEDGPGPIGMMRVHQSQNGLTTYNLRGSGLGLHRALDLPALPNGQTDESEIKARQVTGVPLSSPRSHLIFPSDYHPTHQQNFRSLQLPRPHG